MAGDEGKQKSSGTESGPPDSSASAVASHAVFLSYASHDADVARSIETDPRYKALLQKMNFPE